jgi:hypothetical protein
VIKIQNISGHAVDLHIGALAPGEVAELESTHGLGSLIEAGLLAEVAEKAEPKKGKES